MQHDQGLEVKTQPGTVLSWRLIMKEILQETLKSIKLTLMKQRKGSLTLRD